MVDGVEHARGCGCVISEQVLENCRLVRARVFKRGSSSALSLQALSGRSNTELKVSI